MKMEIAPMSRAKSSISLVRKLRSIYRFLRSLEPVANDTGPVYRPAGWQPE